MPLNFSTDAGPLTVAPTALATAGFTGRDEAAVRHHIDELAELGVAPPSQVPLFYQLSPSLLCQTEEVTVIGTESSGEVEPFLLRADGELWLGLGSDHTDRAFETTSIAHSKQLCGKPVASALWRYADVKDRLDTLELSSTIEENGRQVTYQEGTLAGIRPLEELLERHPLGEGEAMLCGTLGAIGGVRPSAKFSMELRDPQAGRSISADYAVSTLPVVA
ncbi:MAG: DUF2848 domain-containing protein [Rhizobiales bacterium]|nr:DUF2848 domain-containing protein [Hyphomicrobiales bacterium]MBO6698925.1 DUF2848 domain-containing protein [Hyphomicrobiales bacterium]MBO6734822.1 DUF2848 domain-containing protein [Hyphomicrobiales bacterium]MBO6911372.1 DUF2848 domain-containing protein [Hyphomicrobiales bacterium]MBO6955495.1 DUF2848 domain-containing protein [Hyphomicrobiales bacterium]